MRRNDMSWIMIIERCCDLAQQDLCFVHGRGVYRELQRGKVSLDAVVKLGRAWSRIWLGCTVVYSTVAGLHKFSYRGDVAAGGSRAW